MWESQGEQWGAEPGSREEGGRQLLETLKVEEPKVLEGTGRDAAEYGSRGDKHWVWAKSHCEKTL